MRAHLLSLLLVMPACSFVSQPAHAASLVMPLSLASAALARSHGGPPPCDAQADLRDLFAWADQGQGALPQPDEGAPPVGPPPFAWPLLAWVYDTNADQALDGSERQAMLADFAARCDALSSRDPGPPPPPPAAPPPDAGGPVPPPLMDRFDANGDGRLSAEEATALRDSVRTSIREADPPPPPPPPLDE